MFSLYLIAFLSGLSVMGIELTASRLIAPYFGTSLFVWTNVIGVILVALSLGYWWGGKLSEHKPHLRTLLTIILIAGALLSIIPFILKPVALAVAFDASRISQAGLVIMLGSFILTVALFFVPIMLLGMTSPYLIKLVSHKQSDMGNASGKIFAISTFGSIIGTFLPALVFIPTIGSKFTLLFFAGVLIVVALVGLIPRRLFGILPLVGLPMTMTNATLKPLPHTLFEKESPYQYIQVVGNDDAHYLVFNEGGAVQSVWKKGSVWNGGNYWDVTALAPLLLKEGGAKTLLLGLAGGTVPRAMQTLYADDAQFHIDAVEIDPLVTKVADDYFGLPHEKLSVHGGDARTAITFGEEKYDLIMIDAYANQMYIPFHLATQEFFSAVRERLTPRGFVVMNVNAPSTDSAILQAISQTLAATYPYVYRIHVDVSWNYMLYAADHPIDFSRFSSATLGDANFELFARTLPERVTRIAFDPKRRVLTDDWAPLEHMTDRMIWQALVERLRK